LVNTKGGARKLHEGIYAFETPQINGTIDLTEYRLRNTFDSPTTTPWCEGHRKRYDHVR
jgi:hypothetical protein